MKKISLPLILLLSMLGTNALKAQEGLKIGLRFSPIVSFPLITDENGNNIPGDVVSNKLGLSYGLMVNYGIRDNYGLYSGIHIVRKGFERTLTLDSLSATQDVTITSIDIPIALKGRSNEVGNGLFIYGIFGASLDVRFGYKNQWTGRDPVTLEVAESGTTQKAALVNPLGISFLFGAGTEWVIDRVGTINAGLIFHRALINQNNKSEFNNNEQIKVSYLSLDLGYFF
ncbi:MAG: outer membrane beta-barrel protein [Bacteroidota bacterium]